MVCDNNTHLPSLNEQLTRSLQSRISQCCNEDGDFLQSEHWPLSANLHKSACHATMRWPPGSCIHNCKAISAWRAVSCIHNCKAIPAWQLSGLMRDSYMRAWRLCSLNASLAQRQWSLEFGRHPPHICGWRCKSVDKALQRVLSCFWIQSNHAQCCGMDTSATQSARTVPFAKSCLSDCRSSRQAQSATVWVIINHIQIWHVNRQVKETNDRSLSTPQQLPPSAVITIRITIQFRSPPTNQLINNAGGKQFMMSNIGWILGVGLLIVSPWDLSYLSHFKFDSFNNLSKQPLRLWAEPLINNVRLKKIPTRRASNHKSDMTSGIKWKLSWHWTLLRHWLLIVEWLSTQSGTGYHVFVIVIIQCRAMQLVQLLFNCSTRWVLILYNPPPAFVVGPGRSEIE